MVVSVERAYKKLKGNVYFDKTQAILRDRIVDFEGNGDIDAKLQLLNQKLQSPSEEWEQYSNYLISSIRALSLPKSLKEDKDDNVILNSKPTNIEVDRVQYFVDMCVEGHLLGVIWLCTIGVELDVNFYQHSYGNRLRKRLMKESKEELFKQFSTDCEDDYLIGTESPYLFQPYFSQYESWRDTGLKIAQNALTNKENVIVFTMDFKDFFHSIDFNRDDFTSFFNTYSDKYPDTESDMEIIERVNFFVFDVLKTYSKIIYPTKKANSKKSIHLPIGFFPSNLLANWYLDRFDEAIINRWNPTYYGRYVDDVIIVDKVEKNSIIYSCLSNGNVKNLSDKLVKHYLTNCNAVKDQDCCNNKSLFLPSSRGNKDNKEIYYKVNSELLWPKRKTNLELVNKKVRVFYFNHTASQALLTCFRKNISRNVSEFRFLPEDDEVLVSQDYSGIYEVNYADTVNKLRGVTDIKLNKYEFSKFLGKQLTIGNLIIDKKESHFIRDLNQIFDSQTILENYLIWERVFHLLVINSNFSHLRYFLLKIIDVINSIQESNEYNSIVKMRESLLKFINAGLIKALSLVWGPHIKEWHRQFSESLAKKYLKDAPHLDLSYETALLKRKQYCQTRMCDKYLIPTLIDVILDENTDVITDNNKLNLFSVSDVLQFATNLRLERKDYRYYPYIVTPQDINICLTLYQISVGQPVSYYVPNSDQPVVKSIKDIYHRLNYPEGGKNQKLLDEVKYSNLSQLFGRETSNTNSLVYGINVNSGKKECFKIAIANSVIPNNSLEDAFKGKADRSYERYNKLSSIINTAIKNGADMLVLPEAFIPFEWINLISRISAKNQMAIITGVEHVIVNNLDKKYVYNLTANILPYYRSDYRYAHVDFHTKVHYAPGEKRLIEGYSLKAIKGNSYGLLAWNDLWFATYCCYELASIKDRSLFQSLIDLVAVVEWNKDTNYYSNIIESLSRDLHCYCIQVNSSFYGDSRITQPTKTEHMDIVKTKGGTNDTILIGEINVDKLRQFQLLNYELQKDHKQFKPTPPQWNQDNVRHKLNMDFWAYLTNLADGNSLQKDTDK